MNKLLIVAEVSRLNKLFLINELERELLRTSIVLLRKKDKNSLDDYSELDSVTVSIGNPKGKAVVKVIEGHVFYLKKPAGKLSIPFDIEPTLAVGSEIDCVVGFGDKRIVNYSNPLGNIGFLENFNNFKDEFEKYKPKAIVADLHPTYNSTLFAKEVANRNKIELVQVQHHKAHAAGVAFEHNLKDYVAIVCDGLGYGEDGKIWGGEIFNCHNGKIERVGSLEEQPMLGGDSAAIYPKKMLFGILSKFMSERELTQLKLFDAKSTKLYSNQLRQDFNVHQTTSTGRILDAASALLGICEERTYEGRPAMLLESAVEGFLPLNPKIKKSGRYILDTTSLFEFLVQNKKQPKSLLAGTVHRYLAEGMLQIAKKFDKPIVFTGGVAYNRHISSFLIQNGVKVNRNIPAGDGGLFLGQIMLANQ